VKRRIDSDVTASTEVVLKLKPDENGDYNARAKQLLELIAGAIGAGRFEVKGYFLDVKFDHDRLPDLVELKGNLEFRGRLPKDSREMEVIGKDVH